MQSTWQVGTNTVPCGSICTHWWFCANTNCELERKKGMFVCVDHVSEKAHFLSFTTPSNRGCIFTWSADQETNCYLFSVWIGSSKLCFATYSQLDLGLDSDWAIPALCFDLKTISCLGFRKEEPLFHNYIFCPCKRVFFQYCPAYIFISLPNKLFSAFLFLVRNKIVSTIGSTTMFRCECVFHVFRMMGSFCFPTQRVLHVY